MKMSPRKINAFTMLKLPSAYFCGVRAKVLDDQKCITTVKHRWINQNPFSSIFWAVQGMAAELATGALMMMKIRQINKKVSMLVTTNNATFIKKATGRITFTCLGGEKIDDALKEAIHTGDGQTVWLESIGTDVKGDVVSTFNFEWSVKIKS